MVYCGIIRKIENFDQMMSQGRKWASENLFRVSEIENNDLTRWCVLISPFNFLIYKWERRLIFIRRNSANHTILSTGSVHHPWILTLLLSMWSAKLEPCFSRPPSSPSSCSPPYSPRDPHILLFPGKRKVPSTIFPMDWYGVKFMCCSLKTYFVSY